MISFNAALDMALGRGHRHSLNQEHWQCFVLPRVPGGLILSNDCGYHGTEMVFLLNLPLQGFVRVMLLL